MKPWRMIAYSAGSLGIALSYQVFNNRIQFLYIDEIGISPALIGVVWFIYGLWNAMNDPLMGQLSDNTRSRYGRRIPYIAFATLPMAVFFVLMWIPPRGVDTWLLIAYFIVIVFTFDTLWSVIVIAWSALFPEMIPDLRERASVSAWRQVFSILGLILALALAPIVIKQLGWLGMALTFGGVTAASFFVSLLGSHEDVAMHQSEKGVSLGVAMKASLSSRSFRWYVVANLAKEFMFNVLVAALPFYAKYVIRLVDVPGGLDAVTQEALLLGAPFVLSIPGMWLWTKITQRFGSRDAWIYASLAFIPGLVIVLVAPNFTVAIIGTCTLALGFPGLMMIYDMVVADVIDEDELVVGCRREGIFLGMNGAVTRLAFSGEAVLIATILPLTGYDSSLAVQPATAVLGFRFLMAGAPILALLVTIVALRFYPLHGKQLHQMRAQVDELHRRKAARLADETPQPV